jgi:hypothetical protein
MFFGDCYCYFLGDYYCTWILFRDYYYPPAPRPPNLFGFITALFHFWDYYYPLFQGLFRIPNLGCSSQKGPQGHTPILSMPSHLVSLTGSARVQKLKSAGCMSHENFLTYFEITAIFHLYYCCPGPVSIRLVLHALIGHMCRGPINRFRSTYFSPLHLPALVDAW